jgi:hypothetical protein
MQIVEIDAQSSARDSGGPEKQLAPMNATREGMQIVESDWQRKKAFSPSSTRLDPDPKVTIESREQLEKQSVRRTVTEEGMEIALSEAHLANACSSIRKSFESASNAIAERLPELKRQDG